MKKKKFSRPLAPSKANLKAIMESRQKDEQIRKGLLDGFYYAKHFFGGTEEEIADKVEKDPENSYMGMFGYFTSYYQGDFVTQVLRRMAFASLAKRSLEVTLKNKELIEEFRKTNPQSTDEQISLHVYCVLRAIHYWESFKTLEDLSKFKEETDDEITNKMEKMVEEFFDVKIVEKKEESPEEKTE